MPRRPAFCPLHQGKYAGQDNAWALALLEPVILDFDKSIMKYPNIKRFPGGVSNDLVPDLQHPDNPLPLLKDQPEPHVQGGGGDRDGEGEGPGRPSFGVFGEAQVR